MGNGDEAVWKAIDKLREDHTNLAKDGCGHKSWHEKTSADLREDLATERGHREHLGEFMVKKIDDLKDAFAADNRTVRNQILFGMMVLMALTLVIDKVLK